MRGRGLQHTHRVAVPAVQDTGTVKRERLHQDCMVVYQGHHGDQGVLLADVVLPGAAYTEKDATYVNTEGRAQRTRWVGQPRGPVGVPWRGEGPVGVPWRGEGPVGVPCG